MFRHSTIAAVAGCALLATFNDGLAQDYPSGPVTLIVPGSAGSASDVVGRVIGDALTKTLGQTVVVEDRPDGGGTVAGATTSEAPPDGYTILLVNMSLTAAESLHPDRGYVFLEDLAPVARFASSFFVYVVNPSVEAKTFQEFVELAKAKPGEINYSAAAAGTATYLASELLKAKAGLDMIHIPYNGGGPALASVVAGETQFSAAPFASVKPFIEDGKLRALAVSAAERVPHLPDVPAVAEIVPGFEFTSWYGLAVPADTPEDVRTQIFKALQDALDDPEVTKRLENQGLAPEIKDAEQFGAFLTDNIATLGKIIEDNKLTSQ